MKRQIYVPFSSLKEGRVPEGAISLSRETHLGIQIGEENDHRYDRVQVIEIPETRSISYRKQVSSGFVQPIDYFDEFSVIDDNAKLYLKYPNGELRALKPRIRERHVLIYRERLYDKGNYSFSIVKVVGLEETTLIEGFFEVI